MQCHVQEITTALASDPTGTYLVGGTKSGRIYWWDVCSGELLASFQGHFKTVTAAQFTKCGLYVVTASLDGMVRMWDAIDIVSSSSAALTSGAGDGWAGSGRGARGGASIMPYRSWTPHTLPITGMVLQGSGSVGAAPLRVLTCSLDRTLVLFDVAAGLQCFRRSLPEAAESIACNPLGDVACVGGSTGNIHLISLAVTDGAGRASAPGSAAAGGAGAGKEAAGARQVLQGHSRRVGALAFSLDNCTLVSGSDDGSVRVWDTWTGQCVREFKPLNKCGITSVMLLLKPPVLQLVDQKLTFTPFGHLKKYKLNEGATGSANVAAGDDAEGVGAGSGSNKRPEANAMTTRFVGVSNICSTAPSVDTDVNSRAAYVTRSGDGGGDRGKKRVLEEEDAGDDLGSFVQLPKGEASSAAAVESETGFISMNTGKPTGKRGRGKQAKR
jgi:WD40 repeat protein